MNYPQVTETRVTEPTQGPTASRGGLGMQGSAPGQAREPACQSQVTSSFRADGKGEKMTVLQPACAQLA